MTKLHNELNAYIHRSRAAHDDDVRVEELEGAVAMIDHATGTVAPAELPESGMTVEEMVNDARTCVRNDDITGCRIRLLQIIGGGGGSAPALDADKPLDKMTKAELHAYAKQRGYDVAQANSKAGLYNIILDLYAEAASVID